MTVPVEAPVVSTSDRADFFEGLGNGLAPILGLAELYELVTGEEGFLGKIASMSHARKRGIVIGAIGQLGYISVAVGAALAF